MKVHATMLKIDQVQIATSLSSGVSARHRADTAGPSAFDRWVKTLVVAGVVAVSAIGGLGLSEASAHCADPAQHQTLVDEQGRPIFDDIYDDVGTAKAGQVIEDKMGRIKYLVVKDQPDGIRYIEQEIYDKPTHKTEISVGEFRKGPDGHWQPERWGYKVSGKVYWENPDDDLDVETTKPYVYEKGSLPTLDEIERIEAAAEAKARKADPQGWKDVPETVVPARKPTIPAVMAPIPSSKPVHAGESPLLREVLKTGLAAGGVDGDALSRWRQSASPKPPGF